MTRYTLFIFSSLLFAVCFISCEEETVPDSQILIDDQLIEAFVAENDLNYTETESGLRYFIESQGTGARPVATDTALVHYRGTLLNGDEFDSSRQSDDDPAEFLVGGVVPGFSEALLLLSERGNGDFILPSRLAYGSQALSGIPANSILRFQIELVQIQ